METMDKDSPFYLKTLDISVDEIMHGAGECCELLLANGAVSINTINRSFFNDKVTADVRCLFWKALSEAIEDDDEEDPLLPLIKAEIEGADKAVEEATYQTV